MRNSGETFKKDVSDEELSVLMKPHIERLKRFTIRYRRLKGMEQKQEGKKAEKAKGQKREGNVEELSQEEREYLESILEKPNLTITQRRDFLGLSTYKNDQRKKALIEKKLVEEFTLNLGHSTRGMVRLLELTPLGYEALGLKAPPSREFRCSSEHRWWQRNIHGWYASQGLTAEIEKELNGKRADVAFQKDGHWIAVEVGLTPKNEVFNAKADLEAGFSQVLIACKNAKVKAAVQKRIHAALNEEQLQRVKLVLLSEFSFVKEIMK